LFSGGYIVVEETGKKERKRSNYHAARFKVQKESSIFGWEYYEELEIGMGRFIYKTKREKILNWVVAEVA
jgi:hypothetical protein